MKPRSGRSGMTLVEVLVASVLVAGALATMGLWTYKEPWNQTALKRQKAMGYLEAGIRRQAATLPVQARTWEEFPEQGWKIEWTWIPLPEKGWLLRGIARGPQRRIHGEIFVARWAP